MKSGKPNPNAFTPCEIYLEMVKHAPRKSVHKCEETLDLARLYLTGEVHYNRECREVFYKDKLAFEAAKDACVERMVDHFKELEKATLEARENTNYESPKPK